MLSGVQADLIRQSRKNGLMFQHQGITQQQVHGGAFFTGDAR